MNLSFSIPKLERDSDYTELCNLLLKTLIPPEDVMAVVKQRLSRADSLEGEDSDGNQKSALDNAETEYSSDEDGVNRVPCHRFKRLEILGDNIKKLRNPSDFFFRLFREGCANVEEIIIDGILKRSQLNDMVRGLYAVLQPPSQVAVI